MHIDEIRDFLALSVFLETFSTIKHGFDASADRQFCWLQFKALGLRIKRFPKSVEPKNHLCAESAHKAIVG